jgi:hypothetical protein
LYAALQRGPGVAAGIERHLAEIAEQGYTIVERVIEPDLIDALNEALVRLENELSIRPGANLFEGDRTIRIYNLLAHDRVFERVPSTRRAGVA